MTSIVTLRDSPSRYRPLVERVVAALQELHVPGAAVGVLHDGEEFHTGLGITNVDHPLPVDAATLFQVGSITKTVTATAIMQLVEAGRLGLDTPVRTYLPDLQLADPDVTARVTLRHLLTHTAGWAGDYFDDTGEGDDALARIVARMGSLPQLTPLGETWSYSNSSFYIAGRLIEMATGQPYHQAVKALIRVPLGMATSFFSAGAAMTYRVAVGHHIEEGRATVARPWWMPRSSYPVGGLISNVQDLLSYASLHLDGGRARDGTLLLHPETVALMHTPQVEASGGLMWGLGWGISKIGSAHAIQHGGATKGQTSLLLLVPERRFAITILTNADRGDLLARETARWALAHYLELERPDPVPLALTQDELAPYAGRYTGAARTSDLDLTLQNGRLTMRVLSKGGFPTPAAAPPPPMPPMGVALVDQDRFVVLDGPMRQSRGEFLRRPDGTIEWLRLSRIRARET